MMISDTKLMLKKRLRRISGQVTGLERMVDENRYCVDILIQIAAVRSALDSVGIELLTSHLQGCVAGHHSPSAHIETQCKSEEELYAEVRKVLKNFLG